MTGSTACAFNKIAEGGRWPFGQGYVLSSFHIQKTLLFQGSQYYV
jgi:hypothetical protein